MASCRQSISGILMVQSIAVGQEYDNSARSQAVAHTSIGLSILLLVAMLPNDISFCNATHG